MHQNLDLKEKKNWINNFGRLKCLGFSKNPKSKIFSFKYII